MVIPPALSKVEGPSHHDILDAVTTLSFVTDRTGPSLLQTPKPWIEDAKGYYKDEQQNRADCQSIGRSNTLRESAYG